MPHEDSEPEFIAGRDLNQAFFLEAVQPVLSARFPALRYAAALLGPGSDVLGYDTPMSRDHDWGPRLSLFFEPDDLGRIGEKVHEALAAELPRTFRGYATTYSVNEDGTLGAPVSDKPSEHRVEITTIPDFIRRELAFDASAPIEPADWLSFSEQRLLGIVGGAVFHDEVGLASVRRRFEYYPRDVWLYLMASAWNRIGQEEHLVGRAGFVGDELGAGILAATIVRTIMRLSFLMERRYAPYPKWFGTAFAGLACAGELGPRLHAILLAQGWQERDDRLSAAFEILATMHNALGLVAPCRAKAAKFHGRPFHVIHLHARIADALLEAVADPDVKAIAARSRIGGLEQFSDSTDLVSHPGWRPAVRRLYDHTP